ncbi:MAG TPA: sensor histidine kinase KdpD [Fimbriimonadaceae bacterium]|nr:sensor histidine kinase KdpD [Fimbriimonadaceae bacterium]
MAQERPDPDELLRRVQGEEEKKTRGRLKVFLGASAGVGKTYAMLSEAHEQMARGVDVVVGYVETHRRKETDALLEGLEVLPPREIEHRGVKLHEFDIDRVLERRPQLILVDELAHTNAPGSRHPKRYQDIEELLQAGIGVLTTVNIQHLESLNDVVGQITGVVVRETVPDAFIERADDLELIDIPPEELRQRLREGKVYQPDSVAHALDGFFQTGNLIALREMALRRMADRVDAQMQVYRAEQNVGGLWPAKERVLVCIAPNKLGPRVVRAAARIGAASHAEMIAMSVESDRQTDRSTEDLRQAQEALRLAERLGMQAVTASGHDIVGVILRVAQERNATLIVVGKPLKPRWREILHGSVVDELVRRSGDIDVHVITAEEEPEKGRSRAARRTSDSWHGYVETAIVSALTTGLCFLLRPFLAPENLIMIYLVGVAIVATRNRPREAVLASVLSVLAFDFFFVPPYYTFRVSDTQYLLTFAIMLLVALLISSLALRLRSQAASAQAREKRTAALYELSRDLARTRSRREIAVIGAREIGNVFGTEVAVMLVGESGEVEPAVHSRSRFEEEQTERAVAHWVAQKAELAGAGTDTLPNAAALYFPLIAVRGVVGVVGIRIHERMDPQQESLLQTFANALALAIERTLLAKESHVARLSAEAEKMRNILLNSVSHDLRTPLTVIAGSASALAEGKGDGKELAKTIVEQADRLNRHVQNLLDMTRLEASTINPQFEWHSIEELLGSALAHTERLLAGREITTFVPPGLALVRVDGMLVEKALVNLLENVASHTGEGTPVTIRVSTPGGKVRIVVEDRGPGIPPGDEQRIFEKFYQPDATRGDTGFGLGLAICRSVAEAHSGRAWAENRPGGGARFYLELSTAGEAPGVPFE